LVPEMFHTSAPVIGNSGLLLVCVWDEPFPQDKISMEKARVVRMRAFMLLLAN
jgi:hypothetical protein